MFLVNIIQIALVRKMIIFLMRVRLLWDRYWGLIRFKALVVNSGNGSFYNPDIHVKYGENITIGDYVKIGGGCTLGAMSSIKIGNNVTISKNVTIETAGLDTTTPLPYKHKSKSIIVEDNVWIASNVIILGGVTVGKNSIIGAGVVLTKSVKANSIIVGAKIRDLTKTDFID